PEGAKGGRSCDGPLGAGRASGQGPRDWVVATRRAGAAKRWPQLALVYAEMRSLRLLPAWRRGKAGQGLPRWDAVASTPPCKRSTCMRCEHCGHSCASDADFCPKCGKKNPGWTGLAIAILVIFVLICAALASSNSSKSSTNGSSGGKAAMTGIGTLK